VAARKEQGRRSRARVRDSVLGWTLTLSMGSLLIVAGFGLGVFIGVASEEPALLAGHLAGRSTEVPWREGATPDAPTTAAGALASVAAGPPADAAASPGAATAAASDADERPAREGPSGPGGFAVQVGAFASSDAAREMVGTLRSRGYASYLAASAGARDGRWRVRVGPFDTREEAERQARVLKRDESLPTWILRQGE